MFCPTCRTEYRAGFTVCADCGAALQESPPAEAPSLEPSGSAHDVVLLRTAEHFQADMAEALLTDAGIPFYRRKEIAGGLQLTFAESISAPTYTDVVFVPEALLEKAREVLGEIPPADESVLSDEPVEPGREFGKPDGVERSYAGCLLALLAIGFVCWLAFALTS